MPKRANLGAVGCILWLASCHAGQSTESEGPRRRAAPVQGDVVSSVDGAAIRGVEVERLANAGAISAEAALERLQAERLLADEAERRGYGSALETRHVTRQALVQALLARDVEAVDVPQPEIDAAYAAAPTRFEKPELRTATHVLAQLPAKASAAQDASAQAFIRDVIRRLRASDDLHATLDTLRTEHPSGFGLRVEQLPASPEKGAFVPEFSSALFSLPAPGVVPDPVRTEFGWHAIVLTEITPAHTTPRAEAEATLRDELATKKRAQSLASLLELLRQRTRVAHAPREQQLMAALDF